MRAHPKGMELRMSRSQLFFFVKMIQVLLQDSSEESIPDAIIVGTSGTLAVLRAVMFTHP